MRLRLDLVVSTAKDQKRQDLNEDAYALDKGRLALSDGASESYDSQTWAKLLTNAYVLDQRVSTSWVADKVQAYVASVDFASLTWSKQAGFERGSFATLLGLEMAPSGTDADVLAIGDSLALLVRNGMKLTSFPFHNAEQFDARPELLSTLTAANVFVSKSDFFTSNSVTWSVQSGDQILLVTDAIGHWLLSCDEALGILLTVKTQEEFERLVLERRSNKTMRLDDSTVLRIIVDDSESKLL